ncbi:MAG: S8 family serine peptidase, partial [Candidatus Thermoplasmatota archaeon]|nr:S8 family serine peptidase [Candidatus Thermoplasmatota archaeon]
MGAENVHCDSWLCQVEGIQSNALIDLVASGSILFVEPSPKLILENIYARTVSNVDAVLSNHNPSLTGQGQVVAVSDSGIDQDHGDFNGRIRAVYNQYGPDNSAADMHSGHGTHVSATLLGDGSGDSSARGMAPNATFHFYQLEYDQTGALARYGSLFDMFRHSWQQNARIQTNSWGSENLGGQYNSDSRSADSFSDQYGDFLVLFAAGNEGASGSGTISPPSTAKNILTIGASTSGRPGTAAAGQVPTFSSIGPTSDGRIKPDLVSPGVQICSARAQEAQYPMGSSCSSARHSDGTTPLYQQMDGTSMATPVAAGNALLARQFLTDEFGISSPRSDLLKALLVNGAKDIGARDIPNMDEGWGQIDLEQTLYPKDGIVPLNTFIDWNQTLQPGYSYVYTYDWDSSHGVDITIAWTDTAGSSSASQSSKRLVNDLDLTVIAPD